VRENLRVLAAFYANHERCTQRTRDWRAANPSLHAAREAKRRASKLQATPKWADLNVMKALYKEAADQGKRTGVLMHVDHIVPLKSNKVCGLHCPANLRVIPAAENLSKSNRLVAALL